MSKKPTIEIELNYAEELTATILTQKSGTEAIQAIVDILSEEGIPVTQDNVKLYLQKLSKYV